MAIRRSGLNVARVAHEANETFVAPKPLATNEAVRTKIVETAARPMKRVCTIQKTGGFSFFTAEEDRNALDYIAFRHKYEKQNVVRAALHEFLQQHYRDGVGLDEQGMKLLNDYEATIYRME